MAIQCQECKTVYKISEAKLPVQPTKIKCKKCQNEIIVARPPTTPIETEQQANIGPPVVEESKKLNDQSQPVIPSIPKSEQNENTGLNKLLYWIVDKAGLRYAYLYKINLPSALIDRDTCKNAELKICR